MNEVTIRFQYKQEDYVAALRLYYDRVLHTRWAAAGAVISIAVGALCWTHGAPAWFSEFLVIAGGMLFAFILSVNLFLPGRRFRRQPKLRALHEFRIRDSGIDIKVDQIGSRLEWNQVSELQENARVFLLFHGAKSFLIIPRCAFETPEAESRCRSFLVEKITKSGLQPSRDGVVS